MNALLVTDQGTSFQNLSQQLRSVRAGINIRGAVSTIKQALDWLASNGIPDLIISRLELEDGAGPELLAHINDSCRLVLYNQSSNNFSTVHRSQKGYYIGLPGSFLPTEEQLATEFSSPDGEPSIRNFRNRLVVKKADYILPLELNNVLCLYSDERVNFVLTYDGMRYIINYSLDELEKQLNPAYFFRISRSCIISIKSIAHVREYLGNRYIIRLAESSQREFIVSRQRVARFRQWMDQ